MWKLKHWDCLTSEFEVQELESRAVVVGPENTVPWEMWLELRDTLLDKNDCFFMRWAILPWMCELAFDFEGVYNNLKKEN